ncbi:unnamed protein product [Malus baccata var. baccata]
MASGLFRSIAGIGRSMTILKHSNHLLFSCFSPWVVLSCQEVLPNSTEPLGVTILKSLGFFTEPHWYWISAGVLAGYMLIFNSFFTLALMYLKPIGKPQVVISTLQVCRENGNGSNSSRSSSVTKKATDDTNGNKKRGMVLPFEPHSITFDEITYSVDVPQEMKNEGVPEDKLVPLRRMSGAFRPGVLTALMGVSVVGKTTLMDVLAGRKTSGYIEGNIIISGYPKKQESFARISGYCEQNDIGSPHVTVYDSLTYSAWLRLSSEINSETRKVVYELNL